MADLARQIPGMRVVLLNALGVLHGDSLRRLIRAGNISVEVSMLEGVGGVGGLIEQIPAERVLFGSHAPLFHFEAAELKLKESLLTAEQRRAICRDNARGLLA